MNLLKCSEGTTDLHAYKAPVVMFSWSVRARNSIFLQWPKLESFIFYFLVEYWTTVKIYGRTKNIRAAIWLSSDRMRLNVWNVFVRTVHTQKSCASDKALYQTLAYQLLFYFTAATFCSCTSHFNNPPKSSKQNNKSSYICPYYRQCSFGIIE